MISVIVPVYKVEPYLRQCVDSILNQKYRDLEVLLIDDGSPDKCGEICDEYWKKDKRVRVFHTENRGLSAARNLGLKEARGDYIGFVDSDDWIEPEMYEVLLRRVEETGADITVCGFIYEYISGPMTVNLDEAVYSNETALRLLLDEKISNHAWNKLYKKTVFRRIEFPEGVYFEDIAIMHRIMEGIDIVASVASIQYHYRQRADSISKINNAKSLIDYVDVHLQRYDYLAEHNTCAFREKQDVLLRLIAESMSRVLKWWHGCSREEKAFYSNRLKIYRQFATVSFPLFGESTWSASARLAAFLIRYPNRLSVSFLYWANRMNRAIKHYRTDATKR